MISFLLFVRNDIPEKEGLRRKRLTALSIKKGKVRNDIPEKEGLRLTYYFPYSFFSFLSEMIFQKKKD